MTRFIAATALLLATAAYGWLHPPPNPAVGHGALAACPLTFGPWNGEALSFEDAVVEELKADDILVRRYEDGPEVAWLCVVYNRHRRYGAHDPLLCYESQGYLIEDRGSRRIDTGAGTPLEVVRFEADRSRDQRLVYYWWTTEGLTTTDADAFRRRMAVTGALENRSWGAFVRVETLIGPDGRDAAARRLDDFARRVRDGLGPVLEGAAKQEGGS